VPPYDNQSKANPWDDIPEDEGAVVEGGASDTGGSVLGEIVGGAFDLIGSPIVWAASFIFGDTGTAR
jgi:hypothetical protein